MLASELVELLQEAIEIHGDKPVCMHANNKSDLVEAAGFSVGKHAYWVQHTCEVVAHRYWGGPWGTPWYPELEEMVHLTSGNIE